MKKIIGEIYEKSRVTLDVAMEDKVVRLFTFFFIPAGCFFVGRYYYLRYKKARKEAKSGQSAATKEQV